MKMKKEIKKAFRRARRNVCRYIIGFDACPEDCRKNRKQRFFSGLLNLTLAVFATLIFALLVIYSS